MITCEVSNCVANKIDVHFAYSPQNVERMRMVGGRTFIKESNNNHWHVPLDMEACRSLRRAFGDDLTIGPRLRGWAIGASRQENKLGSLALAAFVNKLDRLPHSLPALYEAMWLGPLGKDMTTEQKAEGMKGPGSYQAADVAFIAAAPAPLVGNDQGTGKTPTWIAAMWEAGIEEGCHLVVAPKAAVDGTWDGELHRWQADASKEVGIFICVDDRKDRLATIEAFEASTAPVRWLVVNPAMVGLRKDPTRTSKTCIPIKGKAQAQACYCDRRKGPHEHYEAPYPTIHDTVWSSICIDEAHRGSARNHRSITAKGMQELQLAKNGKRGVMTGTPMRKKNGHDIWGLLHWLRPDVFTSSWRFWGDYFHIEEKMWKGRVMGKVIGEVKDEQAFFRALQPYILRRTKRECAPWLPDKLYVPVDCFMGPKQLKQYNAMEKNGIVEINNEEASSALGVLDRFTRLAQFANALCKMEGGKLVPLESCKVEAMLEKMDEAGMFEEGATRKQLVFSQSKEMIKFVAQRLTDEGLSVGIISGDIKKSADRQKLIKDFQEGDLRVMCLVTTAGGVSITLDAADEVHLIDEMWNPGDDAQAEDRAHRVSRIHQVTVFIYRTIGTIDAYRAEVKEEKAVTHSFILDVRRKIADKWRNS